MVTMKGQTIIEVMVALAVGIIILSAITTAVLTSLNNVHQTTTQDQSGSYATDGLEIIRKMRDTQLAAYKNLNGTYCLSDTCTNPTNTYSSSCGKKLTTCDSTAEGYVREVTIDKNASACKVTPAPTNSTSNGSQVSVTVSWKDTQCQDPDNPYCHESVVQSCLFPIIQQ